MKELSIDTGILRLKGDETYYYCHKEGVMEGMISSFVDDFVMAGNEEFLEVFTEKMGEKLEY